MIETRPGNIISIKKGSEPKGVHLTAGTQPDDSASVKSLLSDKPLAWPNRTRPLADKTASELPESARERFSRLAQEWRKQSGFMSSSTDMTLVPAYQHIIGMGSVAVPLMLRQLRDDPNPAHWFSALEAITEANPVPDECRGNIKAMAEAWVQWGKREGCI